MVRDLKADHYHVLGTWLINIKPHNKLVAWPPLASFLGSSKDTANMGYFDNGYGIYDYEDDVYLNVPSAVSKGVVTVNNVRFSGPIQ